MSRVSLPKVRPDCLHENAVYDSLGAMPCGIDEAGRGSWAGPVVAAAVILRRDHLPLGLLDSKMLTAARREALYEQILNCSLVGVGIGTVEKIDRENILQATFWAMQEALRDLPLLPPAALVDGNLAPPFPCPAYALVKGDQLSCSIAAASIVAKVTRDRIMVALAKDCPLYGWERNKGYGTAQHQEALREYGVTPHHRRSFAPIDALINM